MIRFDLKRVLFLLALASILACLSCKKFDPIVPENQVEPPKPTENTEPTLPNAPWQTIQAGSHALTSESECQQATSDIMLYINSVTNLDENSPQYAHIRQDVYDCFNVLRQIQLLLNDDGSAQLAPLVGFNAPTDATWTNVKDSIRVNLKPIVPSPSASTYTKLFAERFGGGTLKLKKVGSTLTMLIDGHFVCDPIVAYAYKENMGSAQQLEKFSNIFAGFEIILAQTLSPTPTPPSPITPNNEPIAYAWRITRAGSKNYVTSEEAIIASANATMGPINIFTLLDKNSSDYINMRDEVAKCYRLFGTMNITLYQNGTASIDGPSGFNGSALGNWQQEGDNKISLQILAVPLKQEANRFEKRFAEDFLAQPILINYNKKISDRTWHIHGPFVIEPCGAYVKEHNLKGYNGIMLFNKVFKGFDLHLADR